MGTFSFKEGFIYFIEKYHYRAGEMHFKVKTQSIYKCRHMKKSILPKIFFYDKIDLRLFFSCDE